MAYKILRGSEDYRAATVVVNSRSLWLNGRPPSAGDGVSAARTEEMARELARLLQRWSRDARLLALLTSALGSGKHIEEHREKLRTMDCQQARTQWFDELESAARGTSLPQFARTSSQNPRRLLDLGIEAACVRCLVRPRPRGGPTGGWSAVLTERSVDGQDRGRTFYILLDDGPQSPPPPLACECAPPDPGGGPRSLLDFLGMDPESESRRCPAHWLGTTAAARRLGVTTRTLYRFIDDGHIAAYRMGRVIRVRCEDIDAYIETCRIEPGSIHHLYADAAPRSGRAKRETRPAD